MTPIPAASSSNTGLQAFRNREMQAHEAWKSRDQKFWETRLSDKFVGYGVTGRLDKAAAVQEFCGQHDDITDFSLSLELLTQITPDVALFTCEATRNGQSVAAASIYVLEQGDWKTAFHAEAAIIDPATATALTTEAPADTTTLDPETESLRQSEQAIWDAWKDHDRAALDSLTTPQLSFINIFGTRLDSKEAALDNWTSPGCNVQSTSVTHAVAMPLTSGVTILTFQASAIGTCFGQQVGRIWGTAVYVRTDAGRKWTFGINLPARF